MNKIIFAICVVSFLMGCTTTQGPPRRNYTGVEYPISYSTIFMDSSSQYGNGCITKVDDHFTSSGANKTTVVDVAPGNRHIAVQTESTVMPGHYSAILAIPCRAQNMYRITLDVNEKSAQSNTLTIFSEVLVVKFDTPLKHDDKYYTDVNSMLHYWGTVPENANLPDWFGVSRNRDSFKNDIDRNIQSLSVSNANTVLSAIDVLLNRIIDNKNANTFSASELVYQVYESSGSNALVVTEAIFRAAVEGAAYRSRNHSSYSTHTYQPYIPAYNYTPPPVVYTPPQHIYIPPPAQPYSPPTSTYNSPAFRLNP